MANLDLYNRVRAVPQEACKPFSNGSFSGTDISPMWRIKVLTEQFGVCGLGWFIDEVERWSETIEGETMVFCKIHLYIKDTETGEWSKPIVGIGGNKLLQVFPGKNGNPDKRRASDEGYKMAYTDAISVACKALGIGADVYWQNDPTKYMQYYTQAPVYSGGVNPNTGDPFEGGRPTSTRGRKPKAQPVQQPAPQAPENPHFDNTVEFAIQQVSLVGSTEQLMALWNQYRGQFGTDARFVKAIQASPYHPNNMAKK